MTVWDTAPNGNIYPRDVKLKGAVPIDFLKQVIGWKEELKALCVKKYYLDLEIYEVAPS